jgi:predicted nucleic acid-binding protein
VNSVAPTVVCDTNSLWNFAVVERLDILEVRYGHRVAWTDTVAGEVATSKGYEPRLEQIEKCAWLGVPYEFTKNSCLKAIFGIQSVLAAPGDLPTRHLGEAECIHYIEHELAGNGILFSDDAAARDLAKRRGLQTMTTHDALRDAFVMDELACPEPFSLLVTMVDEHARRLSVPSDHSAIC